MHRLFWRSLVALLAYDLVVTFGRFSAVHRTVRRWKVRRTQPTPDTVERVCAAVNHACVWYPKRVLCLQRSAVTTCMLRSQGVAAHMVYGAQKLPFKAHAWVEVDGRPVNERTEVQAIYGVWEKC